jgi:hypothetical protein
MKTATARKKSSASVVISPDLESAALAWPDRAKAIAVVSDETYAQAATVLLDVKALQQQIAATFDPHIARAHEAHKALIAEKRTHDEPLMRAETLLKGAMVAYDVERRRRQEEEARVLREAAQRAEETRRLEEAAALEREAALSGDEDLRAEAEFLLSQPPATVVIAPPVSPRVAGITPTGRWKARVTSLIALIRYVAEHPQFINALSENQAFLDRQATSMQQHLKMGGVEAYFEPGLSVSPGRRR